MTGRSTLATGLATAVLFGVFTSPAAAAPPLAPALHADISRLDDELGLLGQKSGAPHRSRGPAVFEIKFANHDGYTIVIVASEQTVSLSVIQRKAKGRPATTTYLAHGRVTPKSIQASFADRGEIALRFRPSERSLRATRRAGCTRSSGRIIAHLGLFVGKLHFRGEDGYTSVDAHRLRGGTVNLRALSRCLRGAVPLAQDAWLPRPKPPFGPRALELRPDVRGAASNAPGVRTHPTHRPKRTTLFAESKQPLSRTLFVVRSRGQGDAHFVAVDARSEGSIGILRLVTIAAPRSAFAFNAALSNANVEPPAPFSGEASFQHGIGNARSWTGSLAVSFLGAPRVPLAGSPFRTRLVQDW